MNHPFLLITTSNATEVLATSLLHSLWQATVIGLIFLFLLKIIPTTKSALRYKLGLLSLLTILLCWLGTLSILNQSPAETTPSIATLESTSAPAVMTVTPIDAPAVNPVKSSNKQAVTRPTPQAPEPNSQWSIHSILMLIWSTGVILMIIRLFIALGGTKRHRNRAIVIEDPAMLARFEKLCALQNITRNILFAATTTLKSPGVIGIVKPTILIPTSMLTGFTTSDLEAIVAHELAHIRRHDYLFNLLQMVMESLFFFNPAVWWISHRIRMEREACCDQAAMQATGQKFEYANLLLNEFGEMPPAVPAFSSNKKADAKERLLRIVQPNNRFSVRIGATRLILLLTLTTAAIVALAKTSDLAVETVAKILTPKERVEKLVEIADQNPRPEAEDPYQEYRARNDFSTDPKINISGWVKMEDGSELPREKLTVHYISREKPKSKDPLERGMLKSTHKSIPVEGDGSFCATNFPALGVQYFDISSPNSSPARAEIETMNDITNLVLTLKKGFDGELIVQNESGTPIANASVHLMYPRVTVQGTSHQGYSDSLKLTDENGRVKYPHQMTKPVALDIHANGYQSLDYYPASFTENEPVIIQMTKGHRIPGKVVDQKTDLPIKDAVITLTDRRTQTFELGGSDQMITLSDDREIARTDQSGNFTINTIGTNETFFISVKAPGKSPTQVADITTETKQIDVQLAPKRMIRGTLTGDLSKLEDGGVYTLGNRQTSASICYTTRMITSQRGTHSMSLPVTITNGVGHFTLADIPGDWVEFSTSVTDKKIAEIWFSERSEYNLNINLDAGTIEHGPDSRIIEFDIETPEGLPKSNGSLLITYITVPEKEKSVVLSKSSQLRVSITNGTGRLQIPVPAYITLSSTKDIKGYWIEPLPSVRKSTLLIEPENEPYPYKVQATPAGGIHGNILNASGQPAGNFTTELIFSNKKEQIWEGGFSQKNKDSFSITSIPLHTEFALLVKRNAEWIISEPMTLTDENPILNVDLQFSPSKPIEGRVVHPDGTPASHVYVRLLNRFKISDGFADYDYANGIMADIDGHFRWDQVSTDPQFKYELRIDAQDNYKRQIMTVAPGSNKTYTQTLKK